MPDSSKPASHRAAPATSADHGTCGSHLETERWHKPVFILFLVVWLVNWVLLLLRIELPEQSRWLEALLPLLAATVTVAGLARRLPLQNVLAVVALIGGLAWGLMAVGLKTGIPFGRFMYLPTFGEPLPGGVAWPVPLLWVVVILNGREVARLILRGWQGSEFYGFWIMVLTCVLAVLFELGLEPFATQSKGYWMWLVGKSVSTWYTAPWANFLSRFLAVLCLQLLLVPWLINKQPVKPRGDYHALVIWLLLNLWIATGNAMHQHWLAVGIVTAGNLAVVIVATRRPPLGGVGNPKPG